MMDNVREKLTRILASNPELLKNLNTSVIKLTRLVQKMIDNGVTVQEWIPVTERLPEEEGFALIWHDEIEISLFTEGKFCFYDSVGCLREFLCVTHWMPLPQQPKGE